MPLYYCNVQYSTVLSQITTIHSTTNPCHLMSATRQIFPPPLPAFSSWLLVAGGGKGKARQNIRPRQLLLYCTYTTLRHHTALLHYTPSLKKITLSSYFHPFHRRDQACLRCPWLSEHSAPNFFHFCCLSSSTDPLIPPFLLPWYTSWFPSDPTFYRQSSH